MDTTEMEKRFSYHVPKGLQPERYERLRGLGKEFAKKIDELCPESREKVLAITKLEEAIMWANAAIARRE